MKGNIEQKKQCEVSEEKPKHLNNRRRLLLGGAVVTSGYTAQSNWIKPVISSVILPAHATTSEVSDDGGTPPAPEPPAPEPPAPEPPAPPVILQTELFQFSCETVAVSGFEQILHYQVDDSDPANPVLTSGGSPNSTGFTISVTSPFGGDVPFQILVNGGSVAEELALGGDADFCTFRGTGNGPNSYGFTFQSVNGATYMATAVFVTSNFPATATLEPFVVMPV